MRHLTRTPGSPQERRSHTLDTACAPAEQPARSTLEAPARWCRARRSGREGNGREGEGGEREEGGPRGRVIARAGLSGGGPALLLALLLRLTASSLRSLQRLLSGEPHVHGNYLSRASLQYPSESPLTALNSRIHALLSSCLRIISKLPGQGNSERQIPLASVGLLILV